VLERDLSGLSHAARRLELDAKEDSVLKTRLDDLKKMINKSVWQA